MTKVNSVRIGQYEITYQENGKIWIVNRLGEGMECEVSALEKALDTLWDEEF
jgi:hypothetical protein